MESHGKTLSCILSLDILSHVQPKKPTRHQYSALLVIIFTSLHYTHILLLLVQLLAYVNLPCKYVPDSALAF